MNRFAGLALLAPYLRPHRGRVALALLSLLVAAGTVLAFGACLRALIDRGFAQGRPDVLNYALASLLVVAVVLAIASGARFYLVSWLGERVVGNLRRDLFAHVVRLGPAWFEIKRSGDVMSRISADAQLIEQVIGSSASIALRNTLMCVGGVIMLVITNPKLALLVLAVVPLVVAPIILFGRKVRALSREAEARVADMVSEGGETLDAVRTVQAFAQEPRAAKSFGEATERAFGAAISRISRRAVMTTLVIFIVFAAVGFLLWMGGHDVIAGHISAGDLSAFVFYAVLVASSGGAISEAMGELRRALAIVPQEPVLFTATVADNIRYGRPDATDAEVRGAAEAASALSFIEALPQGFATHLGARGVRLSGGQRQRIAIARALLCDPAILLLDEATSALDAESELAVQQALDRLMHKRTTLVIAHRLATVQKADRIVVMDQGRVVDVGRHADLVRRGGLYARLAELQFNLSAAAS